MGAGAQDGKGIVFFKGTFDEALTEAGRTGKLVFMDCCAVWCGPCRGMEVSVFTQEEVGRFFNEHFVNLKMDMEKGEGVALTKRYDVVAYPTLLFINPKGFTVAATKGAMKADAFLELGRKAVADKDAMGADERFRNGDRDPEFLREYVAGKGKMGAINSMESILAKLYEEQGGRLFDDPAMWAAFRDYMYDLDAPVSQYVIGAHGALAMRYGQDEVDAKIRYLYANIKRLVSLFGHDPKTFRPVYDAGRIEAYRQAVVSACLPGGPQIVRLVDFGCTAIAGRMEQACVLADEALKDADADELYYWGALGERLLRGEAFREAAAGWVERAARISADAGFRRDCELLAKDLRMGTGPSLKPSSRRVKL